VFPKVRCSAQKEERHVSLSERTEEDWSLMLSAVIAA
jgi:hypothetical protein